MNKYEEFEEYEKCKECKEYILRIELEQSIKIEGDVLKENIKKFIRILNDSKILPFSFSPNGWHNPEIEYYIYGDSAIEAVSKAEKFLITITEKIKSDTKFVEKNWGIKEKLLRRL